MILSSLSQQQRDAIPHIFSLSIFTLLFLFKFTFFRNAKTCNKCREEKANVLLRHKDGYCKTCFINGTIHKFKAFLGKHRFIRKNDSVLVIFSLGHPTTSLLSFLKSGFNSSTPKQLKFTPLVLYVESKSSYTSCKH